MIQSFFDYAYNAWYPNFNKNLKMYFRAAQNECITFYLKLGDRRSITVKEFETTNWLPIHERVNQCTLSCIYKFHARKHPIIWIKFFPCRVQQNSYTSPLSETKDTSSQNKSRFKIYIRFKSKFTFASLNAFKHNIKDYYFQKGNKKES